MKKTYYATLDCTTTVLDVNGSGEYVHSGSVDLWRFDTMKERDAFLCENYNAQEILAKDANRDHKEQFRFWNK